MEKKNLKEVIAKIKDFINNKIDAKELDEFSESLNVRAYIPLLDKLKLAITIVSKQESVEYEVLEIKMAEFYKDMFFKVLLEGYAMLQVDDEDCTFENYDLLYPVIGVWLLSFCNNDYQIVLDMIRESMSLYNIKAITDTVGSFSAENIEKMAQENDKFIKNLEDNKPLIDSLRDVFLATDKNTKLVVDAIKTSASQTMQKRVSENMSAKSNTKKRGRPKKVIELKEEDLKKDENKE